MAVRACVGLLAAAAACVTLTPGAQAGLSDLVPFGTDIGAGDPPFTLDTTTGLVWLDIDKTTNKTFSEAQLAMAPGGAFAGFRHATLAEVVGLLATAGVLDLDAPATAANFTPLEGLFQLIGVTQSSSFPVNLDAVIGFTSTFDGNLLRAPRLTLLRNDGTGEAIIQGGGALLDPTFKSPTIGHFLVQSAVPAPGVSSGLVLGLLAVARRRRGSQAEGFFTARGV